MEMIVKYEYDNSSFFPKEYIGVRHVKFINPPIVPTTGDMVHLRMGDFFDDPNVIHNFEEKFGESVFYVERLNTTLGRETTEIIIVLYEERVFRLLFPRFFSSEDLLV